MKLENQMFEYGCAKKRRKFLISALGITGLLLIVFAYVVLFDLVQGTIVGDILVGAKDVAGAVLHHFKHHAYEEPTYLGMFYATLIGGLFFIPVPIEIKFVMLLGHLNPVILIAISLSGILISYSFNYLFGHKLSGISRRLISVKAFYKVKAVINRRGAVAILFFNLIGMWSQQITFVLGVFRYNKARLALLAFAGQVTKFIALAILGKAAIAFIHGFS